MGVLDLAAFAEHRVGLVEEEDRVGVARLLEDAGEVLLRLADVLRDQAGKVDLVDVQAEVVGDDLRRHGLAGAGLAGEQGGDAPAQRRLLRQTPVLVDHVLVENLVGDLPQLRDPVVRQYDVFPGVMRRDLLGQAGEAGLGLRACGGLEVGERDL